MSRKAGGKEALERAKKVLATARTVGELRQAQALILPLEFGHSLAETAAILGVSKGWACQLRRQFMAFDDHSAGPKAGRGGRRRENLSYEEEKAFLAPFLEKAASGGILIVGEIKLALDERLGRGTALASTYNLLHRHGWRKLAPDKRHTKTDVQAQEEGKKNSQPSSPGSTASGRGKGRSG
jgi:transposase